MAKKSGIKKGHKDVLSIAAVAASFWFVGIIVAAVVAVAALVYTKRLKIGKLGK